MSELNQLIEHRCKRCGYTVSLADKDEYISKQRVKMKGLQSMILETRKNTAKIRARYNQKKEIIKNKLLNFQELSKELKKENDDLKKEVYLLKKEIKRK